MTHMLTECRPNARTGHVLTSGISFEISIKPSLYQNFCTHEALSRERTCPTGQEDHHE